MSSVYNIEVSIAMRNLASSVLQKLIGETGDLNSAITKVGEGFGIAGAALAVSGGILMGLETAVQHAKELVHQQALYENAIANTPGMSAGERAKEIAEDTKQAWQTTNEVITSTVAENLKSIRELRSVFASDEEARKNLTFLAKAKSVMDSMLGKDSGDQVFDIAKALEIKGVSQDPEHFMKLADAMVKASEAMGGKILGSDFMMTFKYGRTATAGWNDEFISSFLPTLMQELKGGSGGGGSGSTGTALMSAFQAVVGGVMTNKAAEEWFRLGILNGDHIIRTKTGSVKGVRPGGMQDANEFQSNPYQWVQDVLMPAMKAKGITSPEAVREEVSHLFTNRTAQQIMTMFATMQTRFEKDKGIIGTSAGVNDAYKHNTGYDPDTQVNSFHVALDNLFTALGTPIAKEAYASIASLGDVLRKFTTWAVANPELTSYLDKTALSFALFGGMGVVFNNIINGIHSVGEAFTWLGNHMPSLPSWLGGNGGTAGASPNVPWSGKTYGPHGNTNPDGTPKVGKQSLNDDELYNNHRVVKVAIVNPHDIGHAVSGGIASGLSRPSSGPTEFDGRMGQSHSDWGLG